MALQNSFVRYQLAKVFFSETAGKERKCIVVYL